MRKCRRLGCRRVRIVCCVILAAAACGCQNGLYDWGSYDQTLRDISAGAPAEVMLRDRDAMVDEAQEAAKRGRVVPPGKYAQIGDIEAVAGDRAGAVKWYGAEKDAYPESARLMDLLIERLP